ncbi:unnamed protein product [Dovyalis caffra]|uniref:NAC domain-containing protein n=1 Tax=Dovyalis caffra TaxID=77055 RepID=A0AAV1SDJ7_9ROSI|nr:unnamed protein product [Dovyalis caffra]
MKRVGYRFHPTDEEIISYFLKHKMDGSDSSIGNDITEIDLCKFEPWELPRYAAVQESSNDQVWYFFRPRDSKYPNSRRANRTTKAGFWKSTGRDRKIKARRTKNEIGRKKTLVFHKGRVPDGIKTNWVIHEYQPKTILPHQRAFALCKLLKKGDERTDVPACDEGEPSNRMPSNLGNSVEAPVPQVDQELQVETIVIGNGLGFPYPPAMQQQILMEQGRPLESTPFTNIFGHESNELTFQFDADEEAEDPIKLADSFLIEPAGFSCRNVFAIFPPESNYEEASNNPLNDSSPSNSLSRVNLEGTGDTDVEADPLESFQPMGTSNFSGGNARSNYYWQMQTIQTLTGALLSSIHDQHEKEKISSHRDEIVVTEASSSGTETKKYIICITPVHEVPDYVTTNRARRHKAQKARKQVTSINFLQKEKLNMESDHYETLEMEASSVTSDPESYICFLEEVPDYVTTCGPQYHEAQTSTSLDIAIDLPQMETFIMESQSDMEMAHSETSLKLGTNGSFDNYWMSSFIDLGKSPLSHRQNPPSVSACVGLSWDQFDVICFVMMMSCGALSGFF